MALVTKNLAAVLNKVVEIDIQEINNPRVSGVVALFLLSLVFLVITHGPLVHSLAWVILNADHNVFKDGAAEVLNAYIEKREVVALGFGQPQESLEEALEISATNSTSSSSQSNEPSSAQVVSCEGEDVTFRLRFRFNEKKNSILEATSDDSLHHVNITDEEKEKLKCSLSTISESSRPFLDMVLSSLDCNENDYLALLALCLIYALANNKGKTATNTFEDFSFSDAIPNPKILI